MQVSKRALSAKERGRKGGLATAAKHDEDFLQMRSSRGGSTTKERYGNGYFRYLRSLRSRVKSNKEKIIEKITPVPVQEITSDASLMTAAAKSIL